MKVLCLNCGSSSLKFDLVHVEAGPGVTRLARGEVERVGGSQPFVWLEHGVERAEQPVEASSHEKALEAALDALRQSGLLEELDAVGHRVVHGGPSLSAAARIDDTVLRAIEDATELAPLHNRPALQTIRAAQRLLPPGLPMVASFDTGFFAELPDVTREYALPKQLRQRLGIRRYGFHGLAHRYMVEQYGRLRPEVPRPRLITMQLGSGCSIAASIGGRPVDTSMGFTPLEGLIMGTRSGDLDPAIPLFVAERDGVTLAEVESILNKQSGLLGLSGRSNDMHELLKAEAEGNDDAGLAVRSFCYRVRKYIGAYLAAIGGASALVFGGGIGERSAEVRRRICEGMDWAGIGIESSRNVACKAEGDVVSSADSLVEVHVVAVDEASILARDVVHCLTQ